MSVRTRRSGGLALAIVCGSSLAGEAQKPVVADVLEAAGRYLVEYSQKLTTVAAEEDWVHREPAVLSARRRLQSDVVFVGFDKGIVNGFRDVFAVDGREVRTRDDRALKLLRWPPSETAQAQALAWWNEAVAHYMSPNIRTLDFPTIALEFLRPEIQVHSEFSLEGVRKQDGVQVATLAFNARNSAGVLPELEGSTTTGRVAVDVATGTIRQTELTLSGKHFTFRATTKYALEPALGMWLPSEFVQFIDLSTPGSGGFSNMGAGGQMGARQSLETRARYTKFRR